MRQLNWITAGALVLSGLSGLVPVTVYSLSQGLGLIIFLVGCLATIFGHVAYQVRYDKPIVQTKIVQKVEEKVTAKAQEVNIIDPPRLFCESCGTYNSPKYKYCHKCGTILNREDMGPVEPLELPASKAIEQDKQMIVQQDQFSVYMGEKFNAIQEFIDTKLVKMETILFVASKQVQERMMSAAEFVIWAKEKQAEVEAVDKETDEQLEKLGGLKSDIVKRIDYAKSRQGHMAIKLAEQIPDREKMEEFINVQRQHFELQEKIARRLMDWHNTMEHSLNTTKDHINEMFWQAVLASIPAEAKKQPEQTGLLPTNKVGQS